MRMSTAALMALCLIINTTSVAEELSSVTREHTEWVAESLREMKTVRVGMTRAELLRVFATEGGLSTGLRRTYVYSECPYIKVDVEFEPVGRSARDTEGRVTLIESDEDLISQISKPYLDWSAAD